MTKNVKYSLLIIFFVQLVVIAGFELAHDESYYWLYSKNLDWGFFDHPPFVGLVIKSFSFLPHSEFAVRVGFVILQLATVYLLLAMTSFSYTTFLLFFAFPLASFAGLFALPDMGLLFMTVCYCYFLKSYLEQDTKSDVVKLGLTIALLLYAKYHGILLVFFTIVAIPSILKRRSFYQVFALSLVLFLPHILWQYEHQFSTLKYHFLERPSANFSVKRILEYLIVQIGLAGLLVGPIVWKIVFSVKSTGPFERAMKTISIGTVLFFLISSFTKRVEANWTIFLSIPLIYLTARSEIWQKRLPKLLLWISFGIIFISRFILVISPSELKLKRLHEFHGWQKWAEEIQKSCEGEPIMANSYQIASKLSFYLAKNVHALNYQSRKNQFDFWRFDQSIPTETVCYLTDKSDFEGAIFQSPDGKSLRLIKKVSLQKLWALKYQVR